MFNFILIIIEIEYIVIPLHASKSSCSIEIKIDTKVIIALITLVSVLLKYIFI